MNSQNFKKNLAISEHKIKSSESFSKQPTQPIIAAHNCYIGWMSQRTLCTKVRVLKTELADSMIWFLLVSYLYSILINNCLCNHFYQNCVWFDGSCKYAHTNAHFILGFTYFYFCSIIYCCQEDYLGNSSRLLFSFSGLT